MPRPAIRTDRTDCRRCDARLILIKGWPAINYWPDPHGNIAVTHEMSGWSARWLAPQDKTVGIEKRHSKHECGRTADPEDQ